MNAAFVLSNLAPYLGLSYPTDMTMFSGLDPDGSNHFFMPKIPIWDGDTYLSIVQVEAVNVAPRTARQFQEFAEWSMERRRLVNVNLVRYHANRICGSRPNASLRLRLLTEAGDQLHFPNVCAEPTMLRYAVLSKYPECKPSCRRAIWEWAQGNQRIQ